VGRFAHPSSGYDKQTAQTTQLRRPNLLILCSDEQRTDTLGCYGPVYGVAGNPVLRTPHIDTLAREGVRFDRAYVPYPLCSPARASLWTALYPHQHDVLGNKREMQLPSGYRSPVAALHDGGFNTGYVGKWHVPGATPQELGFSDARALGRRWGRDIEEYRMYLRAKGYSLSPGSVENLTPREHSLLRGENPPACGTSDLPLHDYLEWWVTDRAIEMIEGASRSEQPFFLVCGWNAPHFPMIVPAPYDAAYDPVKVPLPPTFVDDLHGKPEVQHRRPSHTPVQHLNPDGWRRLIAHYWGLVSLIDEQVGRIVAALHRLHIAEDTIVVYLSDHGDMMGSHHLMEKGAWNVYEETVHVPLIIRDSRSATPGGVVPQLVSLVDLMPTLLALVDVPAPPELSGQSTLQLMGGNADRWDDVVYGETMGLSERAEVDTPLPQDALDPSELLVVKWLRTPEWKYAYYSTDHDELYNLAADPGEATNLAADATYSQTVESFREQLLQWMQQTGDPLLPHLRARMRLLET